MVILEKVFARLEKRYGARRLIALKSKGCAMFRKIFSLTAALVATPLVALAADLPSRKSAPPPPQVVYNPAPIATWTGFYFGDQIGVDFVSDRVRANAFPGGAALYSAKLNDTGVTFGPFVGYNWQINNNFVLGIEADFDAKWASMRTTTFTTPAGGAFFAPGVAAASDWINAEGSLRGRLGYSFGNVLVYATGGGAVANIARKYATLVVPFVGSETYQSWKLGWTVGAGLEYMFASNWIARLEYRYSQFDGIADVTSQSIAFAGTRLRHQLTENQVRVGLAYKFGDFASPVVARY
jgi:outer membrane immunogenic protein